jgi:predicted kinase
MKKFLQKVEEDQKTKSPVVMAFGRMNPPTTGHEKLVDRVRELANDYKAPHHIIISHSSDAKKNPLNVSNKLKHAKRFFPGANIETSSKEMPTFLHHAAKLNAMGHDHLIMVAGSDRIPEYEEKLKQYNGTHKGALYNFKKIEVKSAGHRDPDSEGAEGMSASKMREHAKNNDFASFRQGIPNHVMEKHARELFRDVKAGMGIHEENERGMFKAIFVSGGPGSGKDIIIREAIAEQNVIEMNSITAINILNDKHKLCEKSRDIRREAIRNRAPLVITGTTNEEHNIYVIREELEELGYETMMVFVNTTNDASKKRNECHERMMLETVRQDRWKEAQIISENYQKAFKKYLEFDNSLNLNEANDFDIAQKEEDISIIYEMCNWFFDIPAQNKIAESWFNKNKTGDYNKIFEQIFTRIGSKKNNLKLIGENKNVQTNSKTFYAEGKSCSCGTNKNGRKAGYKRIIDNICPSCQLTAKAGKPDDVRDGDIASNTKYTFRTYHEASAPQIYVKPEPKETRFQQDNDKQKAKKQKTSPAEAGKVIKAAGVSPEYDTRGQGTVYPMSGLGLVTYKEQTENKYGNTAEVTRKSFTRFRESIDSPSVEMGVTGGYHGPSNKEPLETPLDKVLNQNSNLTKKKNKK